MIRTPYPLHIPGETLFLGASPILLGEVQVHRRHGELIRIASCDGESHLPGGDGVRLGCVRVVEGDSVHLRGCAEGAFPLAVGVEVTVQHKRIDDGGGIANGRYSVAPALRHEHAEIVGCVVCDDGDIVAQGILNHCADLGDNIRGGTPLAAGLIRRNPMHALGLYRDVDARVGQPRRGRSDVTILVEAGNTRRHNACLPRVHPRGLQVEDSEVAGPFRECGGIIHPSSIERACDVAVTGA